MGQIIFSRSRSFEIKSNTKQQFDREVTFENVQKVLAKLKSSPLINNGAISVYVYGMGAHPKSTYKCFNGDSGVDVKFCKPLLNGLFFFLRPLIANYEGLVKIKDPARIPDVFNSLLTNSMAAIYCVSPQYESELIALLSARVGKYFSSVDSDAAYSFYLVDADNNESTTGIIEFISYGVEADDEIIPIA